MCIIIIASWECYRKLCLAKLSCNAVLFVFNLIPIKTKGMNVADNEYYLLIHTDTLLLDLCYCVLIYSYTN